jgi:sugar lactone lactonase YvrE
MNMTIPTNNSFFPVLCRVRKPFAITVAGLVTSLLAKTWRARSGVEGLRPASLAFTALLIMASGTVDADTIYVSNIGDSSISTVDPNGVVSFFANNGFNYPGGLAFDSAGNVYASSFYGDQIKIFSPTGNATVFANVGDGGEGLAFDQMGNLYLANLLDNTIVKFAPNGTRLVFADASDGLNGADGLAFDSAGNLYAGSFYNNRIIKFTPDGTASVFANAGMNGPMGMAFDNTGNLYVANLYSGQILKFTPAGVGSNFGAGQYSLTQPEGLAIDSAGNLYVASHYNNTIVKITPDGVGSVFASGLSGPSFIAIIPEPSPRELLVVGIFGLLLFCARTRCPGTVTRKPSVAAVYCKKGSVPHIDIFLPGLFSFAGIERSKSKI